MDKVNKTCRYLCDRYRHLFHPFVIRLTVECRPCKCDQCNGSNVDDSSSPETRRHPDTRPPDEHVNSGPVCDSNLYTDMSLCRNPFYKDEFLILYI